MRPSLSIVIPAFNEARRIPATIEKILSSSASHPEIQEIIVVDDGSRDDTPSMVRRYSENDARVRLLSYWPNSGKGYAIRRGVMEARGDWILISDADLSTPIEEVSKLGAALSTADVAIGSRGVDESLVRVKQRWHRQQMGKVFNRLMRALTGLPHIDTQCGFKLLPRDVARDIFADATVDRFAFDVEMLLLAHQRGYRVAEVPVLWFNSPDSRVHLVRDSLQMLLDVLRLRLRLGKAILRHPRPNAGVSPSRQNIN
jgi:dolichyl-phosphate beta-glucosyltransferase